MKLSKLVFVLLLATVTTPSAHAGRFDLFEMMENCADRLMGLEPRPSRERLQREIRLEARALARARNDAREKLGGLVVEVAKLAVAEAARAREARVARFKEAKDKFLDTFAQSARREMAVEILAGFKKENSDEADLAHMKQILTLHWTELEGEAFRRLAQVLLARAAWFEYARDVNRAVETIVTAAESRVMSSTDSSLLQISMIRDFASYKDGASVVEGLRFVLGEWSLGVERADLAVVLGAANDVLAEYDSRAQRAAVEVARRYVTEYGARHGT